MPNTIPAAATGLPTRRTALVSLAGLGAALSLPKVAEAATDPDAGLIAFAAKVEALAHRHNAALKLYCDLEYKSYELEPARPTPPAVPEKFITDVEREPDGTLRVYHRRAPTYAAAKAAEEQHAMAMEAWTVEKAAIRRRTGQQAADRLANRLYQRLQAAVDDLTPMSPTTWAGVVAKARVAIALDPRSDGSLNDWEYEIVTAALRDAVRIGGAA